MACEEKCFTFIWKLENISYYLRNIFSPNFVVDSSDERKWYLGLYLGGILDEDYIGFYIFADGSKGDVSKEIKYELAFINSHGSVIISTNAPTYDFIAPDGYGEPEFAVREEVFSSKRSIFLPQDTLIARCKIWKIDGEMSEDILCTARTRIGVQKISFLWNIKDFSSLSCPLLGQECTYEMKSGDHEKELISIKLSLSEGLGCKQIIRFELIQQDQSIKFFTLQLSLVDVSRNKVKCYQDEFQFDDSSNTKEFKFCFTWNKLMKMKNSYLPDDTLSLHWEWALSKGVVFNEIEDFQLAFTSTDINSSIANNMNNQKMAPLSYSLSDSLKSLYDESFLCDVKLKTSTRTFNAHKIILSSFSSVFKAMFSNDMKEKDNNCVDIADLSDDTITQMLRFIYTGRMDDLPMESAPRLYEAADKYDIQSLKDICSAYLKDNLSLSNACEILLLSDLHAEGDLKAAVQNYILANIENIVTSDEWKLLLETNGKLAAETVCLQYK